MSEEGARKRRRFWGPRRRHRFLGAFFALPLLWLCVTGLLLQHQDTFGLDKKKVKWVWLLKSYHQIPEGTPQTVTAGRFTVAGWGGMLFVDGRMLEESGELVGAVAKPAELVIATENEVFVYDAQGAYLDRLGEESLPAIPIEEVGLADEGRVVLKIRGAVHGISENLLEFEKMSSQIDKETTWSTPVPDAEEKRSLQRSLVQSSDFTWSRVVTDLHSGSLLGKLGRLMVDLTGIAVIVLTLFGIRLLFRKPRNQ